MTHTPHAEQDPSLAVIPSTQDPVLPYGTTNPSSGYSGTDTSAERARRDDADGTTGSRQAEALRRLNHRGPEGLTWKELAERAGWHHGQASGALSNLHKANVIARLSERRDRCKVYVSLDNVNGREIEPCAARQPATDLSKAVSDLRFLADYHEGAREPFTPAMMRQLAAKWEALR